MQQLKDQIFMTGTRYSGSYNKSTCCMDGFGTYKYPDGSEYSGYFRNGKFHGYGSLKLAPPNKFIYRGVFDKGQLVEIEDMFFSDNLRFIGDLKDDKWDCSKWNYCSENDRRYAAEISHEIEPVGPNSYLTKDRPPRSIPFNTFDTEEGIYKPSTGFLTNRSLPFYQNRYIGCVSEREWIFENCRSHNVEEKLIEPPKLKLWKSILKNNINTNLDAGGCEYQCECQRTIERENLLKEIRDGKQPKIVNDSASTLSYPFSPSSTSCSSFNDLSMEVPLIDKCLPAMKKLKSISPRQSELIKLSKSYSFRTSVYK